MAPGNGYEVLEDEVVLLREQQRQILDALQMLFDLLEAFAPCWYTEEHHERALAALAVSASDAFRNKVLSKEN
jgi:hypothetical protein